MSSQEDLKEQSSRIKIEVNKEVAAVFNRFMETSSKQQQRTTEEINFKRAILQAYIDRIDWLKKVKDAICE